MYDPKLNWISQDVEKVQMRATKLVISIKNLTY